MPNGAVDVAAGAPNPLAYAVSGDGTVTDQITGLMWQQSVSTTLRTWTDAIATCSTLTLAGHGDWRVPTEIELISLVDSSAASGPTIDATAFPGTPEGYYWSSLPMADSPANAWLVDFNTGSAYDAAVDGPENVRCVRSTRAAAPSGRYTVTGETVYDPRTKLTWQRSTPTTMYGSDDARATCASAAVAAALGGAGWRLPTVKELSTLVDYSVPPPGPTIDAAAFPNTPGTSSGPPRSFPARSPALGSSTSPSATRPTTPSAQRATSAACAEVAGCYWPQISACTRPPGDTTPWTSSTPLMKRTWPGRSIARLRDPSPKECRKPGDQRWPSPNWITTSPISRLLSVMTSMTRAMRPSYFPTRMICRPN